MVHRQKKISLDMLAEFVFTEKDLKTIHKQLSIVKLRKKTTFVKSLFNLHN